jgi:cytochrome c peroxidase
MKRMLFLMLTASFLLVLSCSQGVDKAEVLKKAKKYFTTIPDKMPGSETDTPEKITLGKKLYFDKILSADNTISCNTCHLLQPAEGGDDNLPVSNGVGGTKGTRNAPTVWNAGFHIAQFWDGRAKDLKEQAGGPVLNPVEMAVKDTAAAVAKLKTKKDYVKKFTAVFGGENPITYDNMTEAIAAFERTLISHDRFDDFLGGNPDALTDTEISGLNTFMEKGCTTCHTGALLGGNMYQKMGLINPYKDEKDKGRFDVTGKEGDMYVFKVPSLRNIAVTAPYFHDGMVSTLDEAVKDMAYLQLNLKLTDAEVKEIVAFLNALTDKKLAAK